MPLASSQHTLQTKGRNDCVDITTTVQAALARSGVRRGLVTIFVTGSTAGVTTLEFEPGLVEDLKAALARLFPESLGYAHHRSAGDDNGFSHLRAAFIGPSLSVPVIDGRLQLGTWQQIVLVDFDVRPRTRSYLVQVFGE